MKHGLCFDTKKGDYNLETGLCDLVNSFVDVHNIDNISLSELVSSDLNNKAPSRKEYAV